MGLDTVELILAIEDHFGITISDDDAGKMETVGDVFDYILKALAEKRKATVPEQARDVVWKQLVDLIVYQLGVKPEEVIKTAKIVRDLGAD